MNIKKSHLEKMNFTKVGEITFVENQVKLEVENSSSKVSGVYFWLSKDSKSQFQICYVGKAGYGPKIRMLQHEQGLKNATNERKKTIEKLIKESYAKNKNNEKCLEVWFRVSRKITVQSDDINPILLHNKPISSYSLEEEALIFKYRPILNRAMVGGNITADTIQKELNSDDLKVWNDFGIDEDKFNKIFTINKKLLNKFVNKNKYCDVKIVGGYSSMGKELSNQPLLVFGQIVNVNVTDKYLLIPLSPFTDYVGIDREFLDQNFLKSLLEKYPLNKNLKFLPVSLADLKIGKVFRNIGQ